MSIPQPFEKSFAAIDLRTAYASALAYAYGQDFYPMYKETVGFTPNACFVFMMVPYED